MNAWNEFENLKIQTMRKYACRPNSLIVMKQRFNMLSTAIADAKQHTAAQGTAMILVFAPLRRKKLFVLNEIVAVHSVQLEVLAGFKAKRSSWVVFNGNERIPNQQEIDVALDFAARSARYAVEHQVVDSLCCGELMLVMLMLILLRVYFPPLSFNDRKSFYCSSWIQGYLPSSIPILNI